MDTKIDLLDTIYTLKTYGFQIMTFTFLAILLYNTNNLCGTMYHGIYVYGDCQLIQTAKNDMVMMENMGINQYAASPDGVIEYIKPRPNPLHAVGATQQIQTEIIYINATTTTTTSTTTSTTTPPQTICPDPKPCVCTCPVCTKSVCPTMDYTDLNHEVSTWRPTGAPAKQHGWYDMRKRLLTYTGGETSKYKEGPSISFTPMNYKPIMGDTEDNIFHIRKNNATECVTFQQYPDLNGRKRWNWNVNTCRSSNITICHL